MTLIACMRDQFYHTQILRGDYNGSSFRDDVDDGRDYNYVEMSDYWDSL